MCPGSAFMQLCLFALLTMFFLGLAACDVHPIAFFATIASECRVRVNAKPTTRVCAEKGFAYAAHKRRRHGLTAATTAATPAGHNAAINGRNKAMFGKNKAMYLS